MQQACYLISFYLLKQNNTLGFPLYFDFNCSPADYLFKEIEDRDNGNCGYAYPLHNLFYSFLFYSTIDFDKSIGGEGAPSTCYYYFHHLRLDGAGTSG